MAPKLLKRYAPFLAIIAAQLLLVVVAPSIGPGSQNNAGSISNLGGSNPSGVLPTTSASPGAQPSGSATPGAPGAPGAAGGATSGPGAVGASGAASADDRTKCAKGGVLQQTVTKQSIPCKPAFVGNNGGATYRGVTASTITIVVYQGKVNPVINAVIAAAGAGYNLAQERDAIAAYATFFQKHYEFAGRTIIWKTFQGNCTVDPPDDACLRSEARTIVSTMHPFYVIWPEGRPAFYEELSQLGVDNSGGLSFGGAWARAQAPYHWMAFMDGDRIAENVANYWCQKLNGKDATLAGDASMHTKQRKLGILVREEPANKEAADLLASLVSGKDCAGPKPPVITYSQDIEQAQAQASAGVAALRKAGVTTVVSFGSILEISLQASGFDSNGYHPENLLSGTGLEDLDAAARIVPAAQWDHAFGPADLINAEPRAEDDDALAWKDAGRSGVPFTQGAVDFQEMQQVVWQLQLAGPDLTPQTIASASLNMPVLGGWDQTHDPFVQRYQFTTQGYSGPSDSRQVYWSSTAISKSDGKKGAYVPVDGGRRYTVGTWPKGEPEK